MSPRLLVALGLLGGACIVDEDDGPAGRWDGSLAPPPAPVVSPAMPGEAWVVSVAGVPAGTRVSFVVGAAAGAGPCPAALGGCLDVVGASLLGTATANAARVATVRAMVPTTAAAGTSLAVQAVARAPGLMKSAVATVTVVEAVDLCDPAGTGHVSAADAAEACRMLQRINEVRAEGRDCGANGRFEPIGPLALDGRLRVAAEVHASWMRTTGTFSHDSPGGPLGDTVPERVDAVGYPARRTAENIYKGQAVAEDALARWLASGFHCANLMSPTTPDVGVSRSTGAQGAAHWTAVFAAPR